MEKPQQIVEEKSENSEYLSVKVLEDLPTFTEHQTSAHYSHRFHFRILLIFIRRPLRGS